MIYSTNHILSTEVFFCQVKTEGGLCVKNLVPMNYALFPSGVGGILLRGIHHGYPSLRRNMGERQENGSWCEWRSVRRKWASMRNLLHY